MAFRVCWHRSGSPLHFYLFTQDGIANGSDRMGKQEWETCPSKPDRVRWLWLTVPLRWSVTFASFLFCLWPNKKGSQMCALPNILEEGRVESGPCVSPSSFFGRQSSVCVFFHTTSPLLYIHLLRLFQRGYAMYVMCDMWYDMGDTVAVPEKKKSRDHDGDGICTQNTCLCSSPNDCLGWCNRYWNSGRKCRRSRSRDSWWGHIDWGIVPGPVKISPVKRMMKAGLSVMDKGHRLVRLCHLVVVSLNTRRNKLIQNLIPATFPSEFCVGQVHHRCLQYMCQ